MSTPSHLLNTDSRLNSRVVASGGERVNVGGLNLRVNQTVALPSGLRHEIMTQPSSSIPVFGSYFTIDIKEKNVILSNITLQFILGAVVGTSLVGYFSPTHFWFSRIEAVINGQVIDTLYGNSNFLLSQILDYDEDRIANNFISGSYSSTANRSQYSSQTGTNTVCLPLRFFIDETKPVLLTDSHNIQLRVYMNPLADCFTVTSGTLTSCAILSSNALCKVTRLSQENAQYRLQNMSNSPFHSIIHDQRYATYTVPAGSLSSTLTLSPIVGNISALLFTVRLATTKENAWKYLQLASFSLLDSTSTNICGGLPVSAQTASLFLNKDTCKSSYNTEVSFGTTDNAANYYLWSFSADFISSMGGQCLGSRRFTGNEQLQLTFNATFAALNVPCTVDVYAFCESVLEQGVGYAKKLSM